MLTAVAAVGLGWCEIRPAEAMRIAANALGTDTDTIATMAGAILGAATDIDPPVDVLDAAVFRSEAQRLAQIAAGEDPPSHEYPDLLHWSAPKTRSDALFRSKDGGLIVQGLGRARRLEEEPILASGEFRWQWIKLEFGQTLLIKTRDRLLDVEASRARVEKCAPGAVGGQPPRPAVAQKSRPGSDAFSVSRREAPIERDATPVRVGAHDIPGVVSYVEKHIGDDRLVGKTLRRVVRKGTTGEIAAFSAALIDLLRSHPETGEPG